MTTVCGDRDPGAREVLGVGDGLVAEDVEVAHVDVGLRETGVVR
jgi:hypothetical protein